MKFFLVPRFNSEHSYRYSLSMVADRGFEPEFWLSTRMRNYVLFLENSTSRSDPHKNKNKNKMVLLLSNKRGPLLLLLLLSFLSVEGMNFVGWETNAPLKWKQTLTLGRIVLKSPMAFTGGHKSNAPFRWTEAPRRSWALLCQKRTSLCCTTISLGMKSTGERTLLPYETNCSM